MNTEPWYEVKAFGTFNEMIHAFHGASACADADQCYADVLAGRLKTLEKPESIYLYECRGNEHQLIRSWAAGYWSDDGEEIDAGWEDDGDDEDDFDGDDPSSLGPDSLRPGAERSG